MLPDSNPGPDPWEALQRWYGEAERTEPSDPNAMQLALIGEDGRPNVRTVLLKQFGPSVGFTWYTNYNSRKGRSALANRWGAAVLHWKSLERQVHAEGPIDIVTDGEADEYFASRPRQSQIGAWASLQSEPLDDRQILVDRVALFTARFEGAPVPRPPHWSGFRIWPERMELWQGLRSRLHHRVEYRLHPDGSWSRGLLFP